LPSRGQLLEGTLLEYGSLLERADLGARRNINLIKMTWIGIFM
jgi:hypothetical protein